MANLTFTVSFGNTLEEAKEAPLDITVYAEDFGLCAPCVDLTASCWACVQTTQQVFTDEALTNPVSDGYYRLSYSETNPYATWHIIGGYPQGAGFYN
jgi:hypothetical protein